jgi:hypothetical protein
VHDIAAHADNLLRALERATSALADQLDAPTPESTDHLEDELQRLTEDYLSLFEEVAPTPTPPTPRPKVDDRYEPFLRAMAAFATIVEVVGPRVGVPVGLTWGQHVFSASHFELFEFDRLPSKLPDEAVAFLYPHQAADFIIAVDQIHALSRTGRMKAQILGALERVRSALDAGEVDTSLDMEVEDASDLAVRLGVGLSDVSQMDRDRQVVSVTTWNGERKYPLFQTDDQGLLPNVQAVLSHADTRLRDWPLAIFLARNIDQEPAFFEQLLKRRLLWKPDWTTRTGEFSGVAKTIRNGQAPSTAVGGPLWRVAQARKTPFWFSTVDTNGSAAGGRYDLDASAGHGRGSLYMGETALDAWSETLDRHPTITLRDLLDRKLWTLSPRDDLDVIDLTSYGADLPASHFRRETQGLAEAANSSQASGMRVTLRSNTGVGVVLFGTRGATLPSPAGIGLWSAEPVAGMEDGSLWEYIKARHQQHPDFPVVLRRFPTETRMTA